MGISTSKLRERECLCVRERERERELIYKHLENGTLCHTTGKFVLEAKFWVTAIVVSGRQNIFSINGHGGKKDI